MNEGDRNNAIYSVSARQSFHVNYNVALQQGVMFKVQSVMVDNITSLYAYLPNSARFVPPWTFGMILPCNGDTEVKVQWISPLGNTPVAAKGAGLDITAFEADMGASPGGARTDLAAGF